MANKFFKVIDTTSPEESNSLKFKFPEGRRAVWRQTVFFSQPHTRYKWLTSLFFHQSENYVLFAWQSNFAYA